MKVAVTTTKDTPELTQLAHNIANMLQIQFIPRQNRSLKKLCERYDIDNFITVEKERIILKGSDTLFWHPNMAVPRLKSLRQGKNDPMLTAMDIKSGYRVLDCTLGLASDALVAAYAVGDKGRVVGLEVNKYIAFLTEWGLNNFKGQNKHICNILNRIDVINTSYQQFLAEQPDNSFDVVYFDPMFRMGLYQSSAINSLRPYADHEPLTKAAIGSALRVAAQRVVIKEKVNSEEFKRLNAEHIFGGKYSPIAYGVWTK